jgi:hypothetical protein
MKNSRLQIISSTADSSIQKIVELLSLSTQLIIGTDEEGGSLDNIQLEVDLEGADHATVEEQKTQQLKPSLSEHKQEQLNNLIRLLNDLTLISDFKKPLWYPASIPIDREIGRR